MVCKDFIPLKVGVTRCRNCGMPESNHVSAVEENTQSKRLPPKPPNTNSSSIESYTHDQFIAAQTMLGRAVAVTPATIRAQEDRQQRMSEADEVSKHCVVSGGDGHTKARAWEVLHEKKECDEEYQVRLRIKKKQQQDHGTGETLPLNKPMRPVPKEIEEIQHEVVPSEPKPPSPAPVPIAEEKEEKPEAVVVAPSPPPPVVEAHRLPSTHVVSLRWVGNVDLDLSCVVLRGDGALDSIFYFGSSDPTRGLMTHSGDMVRGVPPYGATESIMLDSGLLPPTMAHLYFVVSSFFSLPLGTATSIEITARAGSMDDAQPKTVASFQIDPQEKGIKDAYGMVVFRLARSADAPTGWNFEKEMLLCEERLFTARSLVRPVQMLYDREVSSAAKATTSNV
eukprot:PhM_4_TR13577/c0_g1_i1/m.18166